MRLVITLGYQSLVFDAGAPVGALIGALEGATVCQPEGYGETKRYVPQPGTEIEVKLVPDGDISLPDANKDAVIDRLLKTEAELTKVRGELYGAQATLKKYSEVGKDTKGTEIDL